jgi:hypothetical protein
MISRIGTSTSGKKKFSKRPRAQRVVKEEVQGSVKVQSCSRKRNVLNVVG